MSDDTSTIEIEQYVRNIIVPEYMPSAPNFRGMEIGTLVSIRPVGEEYEEKSFLGLYLGDLPYSFTMSGIATEKGKDLEIHSMHNPAFFVPDIKQVIFGYESWWGEIDSPEKLRQISSEDIENVWYVKALRAKLTEAHPEMEQGRSDAVDV